MWKFNYNLISSLKSLPVEKFHWIAGFLDGDGHICCRIKPRSDYRYGYQLVPEVGFTQKDRRAQHIFPVIKSMFCNIGTIRRKGADVMVYEITNLSDIHALLTVFKPFLVVKSKQAKYCLDILNMYHAAMDDPMISISLCPTGGAGYSAGGTSKADRMSWLNDEKNRKYFTDYAITCLKQKSLIK